MTVHREPQEPADRVAVAVLAAGQGTRMHSGTPKHLHPVGGVPIVERVIRAGLAIQPDQLVVVVGPGLMDLPERLGMADAFEVTPQIHPYGTAGAVRSALEYLHASRWLISLLGDSPLLTGDIVRQLLDGALATGCKVTVLTCILPDAQNYGRIERDIDGNIVRIVEKKNDQAHLRVGDIEINSGVMVLDATWARDALGRLPVNPQTKELMLTDLIEFAVSEMAPGEPWPIAAVNGGTDVSLGVNDRVELAAVDDMIRRRVRERLQLDGVTIIGPETVFIDETVVVGSDTVIHPFTVVTGQSRIGVGCIVGPHAILHNAVLSDGSRVSSSTVSDSEVGAGSDVGPYAHLRQHARIDAHVHIGTAAEIKNAHLGEGVKVGHFSYLGDAEIGENVNIGAGTITANYDGGHKHPTVIGDGAFIGSDTVIVAPVRIGAGARTGAGAVVTHDVAAGETVVGVPAKLHHGRASNEGAAGKQ